MARVESKTVISTPERLESVPPTADGVAGRLGHWMAPNQLDAKVQELFPGCMRGRYGFLKDMALGLLVPGGGTWCIGIMQEPVGPKLVTKLS